MSIDTYPCPQCRAVLRGSEAVGPGDLVQCPRCATQFRLPDTAPATLPPPSLQPRFPPADKFPLPLPLPPTRAWPDKYSRSAAAGDRRPADLSSEYKVDLGLWCEYASANYGVILGPAVGYIMVAGVLSLLFAIPVLGIILAILFGPPLMAGMQVVTLAQLKGQRWYFGDFFLGFQWWGELLGSAFLIGLMALPFAIISIAVFAVALDEPEALTRTFLILFGFISYVAGIYVLTRSRVFAWHLILDRNFGPMEAIRGSWALSRRHIWSLFGIELLLGVINAAGAMACGIGLLFTLPWTALVSSAGYLLIAGTRPPRRPPRAGDAGE
jgi:hypothetical protein